MLEGSYLGFRLAIEDIDAENLEFFRGCGRHELRLQRCSACGLLRTPPTTACPWCAAPDASWEAVEGRGVLYSYGEVHHAIQPQFREHLPYMMVLVELDTQRGAPSPHEALRLVGNLAEPDGTLASPATVARVGIGTRLRIVFHEVGEGFALPFWAIDEQAEQPAAPWRYAQE